MTTELRVPASGGPNPFVRSAIDAVIATSRAAWQRSIRGRNTRDEMSAPGVRSVSVRAVRGPPPLGFVLSCRPDIEMFPVAVPQRRTRAVGTFECLQLGAQPRLELPVKERQNFVFACFDIIAEHHHGSLVSDDGVQVAGRHSHLLCRPATPGAISKRRPCSQRMRSTSHAGLRLPPWPLRVPARSAR